jgi:hypothetical protein
MIKRRILMSEYCYKVKITCSFERFVYANYDEDAIKDAKRFQIEHSNGYQNADHKEVEILGKFIK